MARTTPDASLMGRVFLALIFFMAGINKVMNFDQTLAYMQHNGLVLAPNTMLIVAATVEIVGAVMLAVGYKARFASAMLFLFMIPTTLVFHDFWRHSGMEMQSQMMHFMKNLAIMGGLTYVATFGAPSASIDARARRPAEPKAERRSGRGRRGHYRPLHGAS